MAASTLLLLWLFQFIFFDLIYYKSQESQIKSISENVLSADYKRPENWQLFEDTAKAQNLNIYVFLFDPDKIKKNGDKLVFPDVTEIRSISTPHYSRDNVAMSALDWSEDRIDEFLSRVKESKGKSFTYTEAKTYNSVADTMICGGKIEALTTSRSYYVCIISSISKGNFTVTIMRNMLLIASALIIILSLILSFVFSKKISSPINKLTVAANQLAAGDFNVSFESDAFDEIKQLATSFNFAKDEMSRTDQMRRDFIANISHDLRTPLTMIKAYAEMIRDLSGNVPEKRNKHCQIIIDESNRLSMLVGDIQNLSKLQSGTDSFQIKPFDLSELCLTVIHRFDIMRESQGYVFKSDCDSNALCLGDYSKIEQVLYNLIGNALNYTGEDKTVTVRCKKLDGGYKVEIIDTGKGIDPEEIDSVWERYYRANQKKRNIVGSGLGLNIVKMILEGHKAKFGVESVVDKGTTFWFILPEATLSD